MAIDITSRHIDVDADIKAHAHDKAEKIAEEFPRVESVHVILDGQKHLQIAEIVVQAKNHLRVEASETSDDLYKAIDIASDRVERQLRKARQKIQDHRGPGTKMLEMELGESEEVEQG